MIWEVAICPFMHIWSIALVSHDSLDKTTQTTSHPLQRLEPLQAIIYGFGLEVQNQYHAQDMKLSLIIVGWQTSNFRQEIR